jgi:PadR family transcriptional regulator PadR
MRAGLPLLVLGALAEGEAHGYALLQRLRDAGLVGVRGSTIYPLLSRQHELGRLGSRWEHEGAGPAKKVFFLTPEGRDQLADMTQDWRDFTRLVDAFTGQGPEREQS